MENFIFCAVAVGTSAIEKLIFETFDKQKATNSFF